MRGELWVPATWREDKHWYKALLPVWTGGMIKASRNSTITSGQTDVHEMWDIMYIILLHLHVIKACSVYSIRKRKLAPLHTCHHQHEKPQSVGASLADGPACRAEAPNQQQSFPSLLYRWLSPANTTGVIITKKHCKKLSNWRLNQNYNVLYWPSMYTYRNLTLVSQCTYTGIDIQLRTRTTRSGQIKDWKAVLRHDA